MRAHLFVVCVFLTVVLPGMLSAYRSSNLFDGDFDEDLKDTSEQLQEATRHVQDNANGRSLKRRHIYPMFLFSEIHEKFPKFLFWLFIVVCVCVRVCVCVCVCWVYRPLGIIEWPP